MLFYTYIISPLAYWLLQFLALFFTKIQMLLDGRKGLLDRWRKADLGEHRIWFHVASVGELEQIRPVLEAIERQNKYSLILSYYSSSVPKLVRDWSFVRYADYLPLDKISDMRELVQIIRPQLLVLNRYDLWPNHLFAAKKAGIPIALVNASTPPLGILGALSLGIRKSLFQMIDFWSYVDPEAATAWEPYVRKNIRGLVAGNPRVDRALRRVELAAQDTDLKKKIRYWQQQDRIVCGSTWPSDEENILAAYSSLRKKNLSLGLVLVPHEPEEAHLLSLEKKIAALGMSSQRLSRLCENSSAAVLLVDGRGFLAELYGVAQVSYVGGGFGREIHSVIEPLAHGLPVAFGPHFRRSPEAEALLRMGAAYVANDGEGLALWFATMLSQGQEKDRAREALRIYLAMHRGAGERVAYFLLSCLENSTMLPR